MSLASAIATSAFSTKEFQKEDVLRQRLRRSGMLHRNGTYRGTARPKPRSERAFFKELRISRTGAQSVIDLVQSVVFEDEDDSVGQLMALGNATNATTADDEGA